MSKDNNKLDSVLLYDINQNKCTQMAPLPFPASSMAVVCWEDCAILIGGWTVNGTIDSVVAYNAITGESKLLPSMKDKKTGSTAVVRKNMIVVIGGWSNKNRHFNSVECFSFLRNSWEDRPPMNERRICSTSV